MDIYDTYERIGRRVRNEEKIMDCRKLYVEEKKKCINRNHRRRTNIEVVTIPASAPTTPTTVHLV